MSEAPSLPFGHWERPSRSGTVGVRVWFAENGTENHDAVTRDVVARGTVSGGSMNGSFGGRLWIAASTEVDEDANPKAGLVGPTGRSAGGCRAARSAGVPHRDGTSNILNAESTPAGAALALGGAATLVVGLWARPKARGLGNALIVAGAALAAIWFWTVVMTPIAFVLVVGVVLSQVRSTAPAAGSR